jgi:hypothetical protein
MTTTEGLNPGLNSCACQCGGYTKATFLPGHDAKHVAWIFSNIRYGVYGADQGLEKLDITAEYVYPGASAALYNKLVNRLTKAGYIYSTIWGRWFAPESTSK